MSQIQYYSKLPPIGDNQSANINDGNHYLEANNDECPQVHVELLSHTDDTIHSQPTSDCISGSSSEIFGSQSMDIVNENNGVSMGCGVKQLADIKNNSQESGITATALDFPRGDALSDSLHVNDIVVSCVTERNTTKLVDTDKCLHLTNEQDFEHGSSNRTMCINMQSERSNSLDSTPNILVTGNNASCVTERNITIFNVDNTINKKYEATSIDEPNSPSLSIDMQSENSTNKGELTDMSCATNRDNSNIIDFNMNHELTATERKKGRVWDERKDSVKRVNIEEGEDRGDGGERKKKEKSGESKEGGYSKMMMYTKYDDGNVDNGYYYCDDDNDDDDDLLSPDELEEQRLMDIQFEKRRQELVLSKERSDTRRIFNASKMADLTERWNGIEQRLEYRHEQRRHQIYQQLHQMIGDLKKI